MNRWHRTVPQHRPSHRRVAATLLLCAAATLVTACRATAPGAGEGSVGTVAVTTTLGVGGKDDGAAPAAAAATEVLSSTVGAAPTTAEHLTAEDEAAMVALVRTLFGPMAGSDEPDMQDTIVRQISTFQLRELRGDDGPTDGAYGRSAGFIWIVGFRTTAPLTLSTFSVDETTQLELKDVGPTASLAGPDGRTSVYYIVSTQSIEGDRRFVPMSQGVLVEGTSSWSLDDLAALPATP